MRLAKGQKLSARYKSIERQSYLLIALPLIGFFTFTLYPIVWSIIKSFYFYDQVPSHTVFTGLQNFKNLFADGAYWKTWVATFKFMIYKLPFEVFLTLILAVLLGKKLKGSGFFRGFYYMPCVISVAIVGLIFSNFFDYFGFLNHQMVRFGIIKEPIDWFATEGTAFFVLCIGSIWSHFGTNVLYFSAAITNVPDDLYEAAEIDGAGSIRKFWSITIPMIAPVFRTILLLAINGTLHVGEYIVVLTNGAPAGSTHTVGSYMITQFLPGFVTGAPNIGYGCAMALVNSIIYGLVAVIYRKLSDKMKTVY